MRSASSPVFARFERRIWAFPHDYRFGPAIRPALYWKYMKTKLNRAADAQRKPRTVSPQNAAERAQRTAWAWPGLTQAELREHIIDQIG